MLEGMHIDMLDDIRLFGVQVDSLPPNLLEKRVTRDEFMQVSFLICQNPDVNTFQGCMFHFEF